MSTRWLVSLMALATGCYESHFVVPITHPEVGPDAAMEAEAFAQLYFEHACRQAIDNEAAEVPALAASQAKQREFIACDPRGRRAHYPWRGYDTDAELFAAIEAGRVGFDPQAAASCRAIIEGRPVPDAERNACMRVFISMVSDGPCASGVDCRSGRCESDSTCDPSPPLAPGERCDLDRVCDVGFLCLRDLARGPGAVTCQTAWTQTMEGAPCGNAGLCGVGLYCASTEGGRRCLALPTEGEPCGLEQQCARPLVCSRRVVMPDVGRCVRGLGEGAACDLSRPCDHGLRCAGGWCRRIILPDEPCDDMHVCPLTYYCEEGRCVPLRDAGEACSEDAQCLRSYCDSSHCASAGRGALCAESSPGATCEERCMLGGCTDPGRELDPCMPGAGLRQCESGLRCARSWPYTGQCRPE